MNKIILCCIFAVFLSTAAPAWSLEGGDDQATVDHLVEMALNNNPDLVAAHERWQMFERKVVPAKTLSDPKLSFAFSNYPVDSLSPDDTPMTGNDLRLDQAFPFPGKLKSRGDAARQQALWYRYVFEDARLQLAGKVREQFYQLYFIDRAIQVTRENLDLLLDFTRLTETRYATGMGLQQDVLKAQLEHSRMTERLLRLEQERRSAAAELYSLVGTDQESEIRTGDLSLPLSADLAEATLVQLAVEQRPMFQAYDALGKGYSAQRESARLDYYPDLNLWAGYRFREEVPGDPVPGTDFVSAGISINLPLFREKRSEAVAEAESGQRMVLSQAREFRNQVRRAIRDNLAQVNKNRSLVDLYRSGIVPQAHQAVEAGVSAYQVGELEFLSLLDSLLTLDRYQVDLYRAEADYLRSLARLEAVVGGHLEKASLSSPATQEKRP